LNSSVDTLTFIKSHFRGREDPLERSYWQSVSFRSLCEDYRDCFAAREHWRQQPLEDSRRLELEYTELLAKLNIEISGWLENPP
jgi:hypothetical protein